MRLFSATLVCLSFLSLAAQTPRGTLRFISGAQNAEFQVISGNHPAFISLRPEHGELAMLRDFLLTHTGPEKLIATKANPLKTVAPAAWKVAKHRGAKLIQTEDATYWCYTPGLVLPSTFRIGQATWKLQSADLPPLIFVELQ